MARVTGVQIFNAKGQKKGYGSSFRHRQ